MTDCIFLQLATYSLEELRIERPESVSWRDPEGFHFQAQAYALLGVYDLVCSHFAESLADPELTTAAAGYIAHAIDCQGRLKIWLSAATRTKRLKGVPPSNKNDICPKVLAAWSRACVVYMPARNNHRGQSWLRPAEVLWACRAAVGMQSCCGHAVCMSQKLTTCPLSICDA